MMKEVKYTIYKSLAVVLLNALFFPWILHSAHSPALRSASRRSFTLPAIPPFVLDDSVLMSFRAKGKPVRPYCHSERRVSQCGRAKNLLAGECIGRLMEATDQMIIMHVKYIFNNTSLDCIFDPMRIHQYYTYIITNHNKTVLYTGMTNNIQQRLADHYFNAGSLRTFTGRYNCHFLLYYEIFQWVQDSIAREKQIKGWSREKKERLINALNPDWKFLNEKVMEWPPKALYKRDR